MVIVPIILLVIIYFGFTLGRVSRNASSNQHTDIQALINDARMLNGSDAKTMAPSSKPGATEDQKFIERLKQQHGLDSPPADSSGNVNLQGGGSISKEQYQRTLDGLKHMDVK